jgi:hypothetical protein
VFSPDDEQAGSNTVSTDGEALGPFATEGLPCLTHVWTSPSAPLGSGGRQLPPWLAEPLEGSLSGISGAAGDASFEGTSYKNRCLTTRFLYED